MNVAVSNKKITEPSFPKVMQQKYLYAILMNKIVLVSYFLNHILRKYWKPCLTKTGNTKKWNTSDVLVMITDSILMIARSPVSLYRTWHSSPEICRTYLVLNEGACYRCSFHWEDGHRKRNENSIDKMCLPKQSRLKIQLLSVIYLL